MADAKPAAAKVCKHINDLVKYLHENTIYIYSLSENEKPGSPDKKGWVHAGCKECGEGWDMKLIFTYGKKKPIPV